jgi:hypothetical protein
VLGVRVALSLVRTIE